MGFAHTRLSIIDLEGGRQPLHDRDRTLSLVANGEIIVDTGGKLVPIEVKLSATPRPAMGHPIDIFQQDFADRALPGYVVHPGDVRLPLGAGVTALPFGES